jgi:tetratricopeptide (TPR) repeat protein
MIYDATGDDAKAVADYTQQVRLAPDDAMNAFSRALVYHRMGQKDLAIQDLEKAVSLHPEWQEFQDKLQEIRGW